MAPVPAGCFGSRVRPAPHPSGAGPTFQLATGRRHGRTEGAFGLGWCPDLPDFRDWRPAKLAEAVDGAIVKRAAGGAPRSSRGREILDAATASVEAQRDRDPSDGPVSFRREASRYGLATDGAAAEGDVRPLPGALDLRRSGWLSPVENQGHVGACTAHAVVGAVEALNNRLGCDPMDLSRLFLYKATRNLLGWPGDVGAHIRTTIKALRLFGVPPETYWPYDPARFDDEPDAFHYAFGGNYKATKFARLDQPELSTDGILRGVKQALVDGQTVPFGFTVFESIRTPKRVGEIPFPRKSDQLVGGHAVLAVGYDDDVQLESETPGALIVQNSWGREWGDAGYGYLPYDYVLSMTAADFWVVLVADWVSERVFE